MFRYFVAAICAFMLQVTNVTGQQLVLSNGHRKIKILPNAAMEVFAYDDSAALNPKKGAYSFSVSRITPDSIELRRPTAWKDSFYYKFNAFTGKDNLNKKTYYKAPSAWEYQVYAMADINMVRYTFQRDQSGNGGTGALLVPGLNLYYLWSKWWRTRTFDMKKWKFIPGR